MKKGFAVFLALMLMMSLGGGKADAGRVTSLREFAEALEKHTAQLEESFAVSCDSSVIKALKQESPIGKDSTLLAEFMSLAGCAGTYRYGWENHSVMLSDVSYYTGWRILQQWRAGQTDLLSDREKQTLEAAEALVSGAHGSDLEKERYIYDALCGRITYQLEDVKGHPNEKDSAVGALLNGAADCDGYADAMVLCCGLAGIPCRYMHGESRKPALPDSPDGNHMWNLVQIDGDWLMCDVTWGDQKETSYLYFNLGKQDAGDSYAWSYETLFTNVIDTADFSRHRMADQQPATVRTQAEVYTAARAATLAGLRRLTLFCPEDRLWETGQETFNTMLAHGGFGTISFDKTGRLFEVMNESLPDVFCFCDTEGDILSAIDHFAENQTGSFTLYLSPDISREMLSDECTRLREVFSRSRLENPGLLMSFSEQSGSVSLTNVTYAESLPVCYSKEDVDALMAKTLPGRPDTLEFLLGDGYMPTDIGDILGTAVYARGASSFRYGSVGSRVTVSDITYYNDYCLAASEEDVADYLQKARTSGIKDVRIYCTPSLYANLMANQSVRFFTLMQNAGFSLQSFSYNNAYGLLLAENLT